MRFRLCLLVTSMLAGLLQPAAAKSVVVKQSASNAPQNRLDICRFGGDPRVQSDIGKEEWSPRSSVTARYVADLGDFSDPIFMAWPATPILASRDRTKFLVVTKWGDLAADQNVYSARVFRISDVSRAILEGKASNSSSVTPAYEIELRSGNNVPGIVDPKWASDGKALVFRGAAPGKRDREQYYYWDFDTGNKIALTHAQPLEAGGFRLVDNQEGSAIYVARDVEAIRPVSASAYPASIINADTISGYFPGSEETDYQEALYLSRKGVFRRIMSLNGPEVSGKISANGAKAVVLVHPETSGDRNFKDIDLISDQVFVDVDLETGQLKVIGQASTVGSFSAISRIPASSIWLGSRNVVLVNANLSGELLPRTPGEAFVAVYDTISGRSRIITPMVGSDWRVRAVEAVSDSVLKVDLDFGAVATVRFFDVNKMEWIEYGGDGGRLPSHALHVEHQYDRKYYQRSDEEFALPHKFHFGNISIWLQESPNRPQSLIASDGVRSVSLLPPDPAIAGVRLEPSCVVEWSVGSRVHRGLLTLPHSRPPEHLPLVVQVGSYSPNLFRPDGSAPSAYGAQSLAQRGIAVLQINSSTYEFPGISGPEDVSANVRLIDGFVDVLAKMGVVDRMRVGLVGFSRNGFYSLYAITHPGTTKFAAAVVGDSWMSSFGLYVQTASSAKPPRKVGGRLVLDSTRHSLRKNWDELMGGNGQRFWANKEAWMDQAIDFNIDKVTAPLLYTSIGMGAVSYTINSNLLGTFGLTDKPVEILNFGSGAHPLQRPKERYESISATIEWMQFWLTDVEPSDPVRRDRWGQMKLQLIKIRAEEDRRDVALTSVRKLGIRVRDVRTLISCAEKEIFQSSNIEAGVRYLTWNTAIFKDSLEAHEALAIALFLKGDMDELSRVVDDVLEMNPLLKFEALAGTRNSIYLRDVVGRDGAAAADLRTEIIERGKLL